MQYYHDFANDKFLNEKYFKNKKNGFFIEIGATDGIGQSSCYFFEKNLEWDGLCVEPARVYHDLLRQNRKRPIYKAVCDKTIKLEQGGITFYESSFPMLSGIKDNLEECKKGQIWEYMSYNPYQVETITLFELLEEENSPINIDYCAIDAEGSEYAILKCFFETNKNNNNKFKIDFFSIEMDNDEIKDLLIENNYDEIINPYLKDMRFEGREITWERYFKRKESIL